MHPEDEPEQIQQQRAIERRMEQRRAEQRRLEQRLADQEERARQSREHIRQARDVMRREMQLQVQRGLHHRMKKLEFIICKILKTEF